MQNQTHPKIIYLMKKPWREWIKILKLFRIDIRAEIFTNPQKTGVALTRPRRVGVTEARATNTTTNGKSTDWGKGNFSDIRHQYTRIRKVYKFHGGNISTQIKHLLYPELQVLALLIMNKYHLQHQFCQMHEQLYQQHGETLLKQNTTVYSKDGQTFVVKGILDRRIQKRFVI